jgi:hypothetical protein
VGLARRLDKQPRNDPGGQGSQLDLEPSSASRADAATDDHRLAVAIAWIGIRLADEGEGARRDFRSGP